MYGGDEVNAVVVDLGSSTVKAGYAGEDTPKAVFPSSVGCLEHANGAVHGGDGADKAARDLFAGSQALAYRKDDMEVLPALNDGLYADWDAIHTLWDHAFRDRLRIDPAEQPLMFAEPSFQPKDLREQTVEAVFERYAPPALFLAKNAVLSSFATGRQTSLVVDAGHEATVAAPVQDGYVLQKAVVRTPLGGGVLSQCMLASVAAKGVNVDPTYAFRRRERAPGQFEVERLDLPGTRSSFRRFHVEAIAADIKEAVCRVSDGPFDAEENANIPTVSYELPDGNEIQIGPDRFKKLLSTFEGMRPLSGYDGAEVLSVPALVLESINRCDVDVRRDMYNGVIITGGTSLFTAVRDRLERELVEAAPQTAKVKVTAPSNSTERRFSVWIGGSILASLGSFQQMWMSKAEYAEHGANLIHRKAP